MTIQKTVTVVIAALTLTLIPTAAIAFQGANGVGGVNGAANSAYAIGVWGDLPYSDVQATIGMPNLIADMNSQTLASSVHDGDLKAGSNSPCDDALYIRSLGYLNALEASTYLTPPSEPRSGERM